MVKQQTEGKKLEKKYECRVETFDKKEDVQDGVEKRVEERYLMQGYAVEQGIAKEHRTSSLIKSARRSRGGDFQKQIEKRDGDFVQDIARSEEDEQLEEVEDHEEDGEREQFEMDIGQCAAELNVDGQLVEELEGMKKETVEWIASVGEERGVEDIANNLLEKGKETARTRSHSTLR